MTPLSPKIKEYWARYTAWQRDPMHILGTTKETAAPALKQHRCANCYTLFDSENCPNCGQKHNVGRITWASIWQGIMDLWGLGTRSLPYTLWQLIWRPGYLIGDYISGRRQVSFPPVKMLVIVALVAMLALMFFDIYEADTVEQTTETVTETNTTRAQYMSLLDSIFDWASKHYDWTALILLSFYILPVYVVFREAPRCGRHTLAEGFFIQVFMATQFLIYLILTGLVVFLFPDISDNAFLLFFSVLVLLVHLRNYRQLFGYKVWGTLWRYVVAATVAFMLLVFALNAMYIGYMLCVQRWENIWDVMLHRALPSLAVTVVLLWISARINRRTSTHIG